MYFGNVACDTEVDKTERVYVKLCMFLCDQFDLIYLYGRGRVKLYFRKDRSLMILFFPFCVQLINMLSRLNKHSDVSVNSLYRHEFFFVSECKVEAGGKKAADKPASLASPNTWKQFSHPCFSLESCLCTAPMSSQPG